jgi:hypothetical protein
MRGHLSFAAALAVVLLGCRRGADNRLRARAQPGAAEAATAKAAAARVAGRRFVDELDVKVFQKGNIHTHSTESDGHSSPRDVYGWYRQHGYNFLAMTDHNTMTNPTRFRSLETKHFIIIPGEEVTMNASGTPVHINSLCTFKQIGPGYRNEKRLTEYSTIPAAMGWAIKSILAAKGVALVNHPNFRWAFGVEALPAARGAVLLEIFSGQPGVHSQGEGYRPSEEAIWDQAWVRGMHFAPVAVDDMHVLREDSGSGPGRGWVRVFANETTQAAICDGLAKGKLYASSGAELRRFQVTPSSMNVWPDMPATVEFLAPGGRVLQTLQVAAGAMGSYRLIGNEGAVRARITSPHGTAWTGFYELTKT